MTYKIMQQSHTYTIVRSAPMFLRLLQATIFRRKHYVVEIFVLFDAKGALQDYISGRFFTYHRLSKIEIRSDKGVLKCLNKIIH
mmetsp:Transcript_10944/g.16509  ORF Transcript_10944/g.16509 Transcript_10944/m.16509 type:complete len:84 (+) Transcript_10944:524-775(+)